MKFICTSDWHLGNLFHGNDRKQEHEHFFEWLIEQVRLQQPDALLVAGDVFDNGNPSAASQAVYYNFLADVTRACPKMQVVITAGNHDSASRLEAPRPLLSRYHVEVRGSLPRKFVQDEEQSGTWVVDYEDMMIPITNDKGEQTIVLAVPFLRADVTVDQSYSKGVNLILHQLTDMARQKYPNTPIVLMAHMYAEGAEIREHSSERIIIGGQEQVNLEKWEDHPDYFTCGHIHKRQHIWDTEWARYSGSILPMSFAERDYKHGVDIVTITEGQKPQVDFLEYPVQHPLVSLPQEGAATKKDLLKLIETLPNRPNGTLTSEAVYLELKLLSNRVLAEDRTEIETALQKKDAIICCLQQVNETLQVTTLKGENTIASLDDLLNRDPMEAVQECYEATRKKPLNEKQKDILRDIINTLPEIGN